MQGKIVVEMADANAEKRDLVILATGGLDLGALALHESRIRKMERALGVYRAFRSLRALLFRLDCEVIYSLPFWIERVDSQMKLQATLTGWSPPLFQRS